MKSANRELVERLAAEYVLGTLRGRARRHFERWLISPQVSGIVNAWEERLAGFEPSIEPVSPPASAWHGIESRLGLRALERRPVMHWLAVAASLLIAALIGFFMWRPGAPVTQVASIRADARTIYWRVQLLGDRRELSVQVLNPYELQAGKSLELWVLPAEGVAAGKPVSLGLLPTRGAARRALTAAQRAALAGARQLAVSLEPAAGSPTGLPTGPVLHVAGLSGA